MPIITNYGCWAVTRHKGEIIGIAITALTSITTELAEKIEEGVMARRSILMYELLIWLSSVRPSLYVSVSPIRNVVLRATSTKCEFVLVLRLVRSCLSRSTIKSFSSFGQ